MYGIQAMALRAQAIEKAWERFDEKQAAREAEIRRPGRKVNVMSNEEWDRIIQAKRLSNEYFSRFSRETYYRDAGVRQGITGFLTENYPKAPSEAVSRVGESLINSLILYFQAACDPCFSDAGQKMSMVDVMPILGRVPGYRGAIPSVESPSGYGLLAIVTEYLGIKWGSVGLEEENATATLAAVKEKKPPSQFIIELIKKDLKAGSKYPSAAEQEILKGLVDGGTTQEAFVTLVKELYLMWNTVLQALGSIIPVCFMLIPEGAGPIPSDKFEERLTDAEALAREWQEKNRDEVSKVAENAYSGFRNSGSLSPFEESREAYARGKLVVTF